MQFHTPNKWTYGQAAESQMESVVSVLSEESEPGKKLVK
jgi:hypothetical protein